MAAASTTVGEKGSPTVSGPKTVTRIGAAITGVFLRSLKVIVAAPLDKGRSHSQAYGIRY